MSAVLPSDREVSQFRQAVRNSYNNIPSEISYYQPSLNKNSLNKTKEANTTKEDMITNENNPVNSMYRAVVATNNNANTYNTNDDRQDRLVRDSLVEGAFDNSGRQEAYDAQNANEAAKNYALLKQFYDESMSPVQNRAYDEPGTPNYESRIYPSYLPRATLNDSIDRDIVLLQAAYPQYDFRNDSSSGGFGDAGLIHAFNNWKEAKAKGKNSPQDFAYDRLSRLAQSNDEGRTYGLQ